MRKLLSAAVLVAVATAAGAAGPVADGNWLLAGILPTGEAAQMIIKVETTDGKQTASLLYAPPAPTARGAQAQPRPPEVRDFRVKDNVVTIAIAQSGTIRSFVGIVGVDTKRILGTLGTEAGGSRAVLSATDKEKFEAADRLVRSPAASAYTAASQLSTKSLLLRSQAQREMDAEKKAQLLKDAVAAVKEADEKLPGMYRDIIKQFPTEPAALEAALQLIRTAGKEKASLGDVTAWVALVEKEAAGYGPRFAKPTLGTVADTLADVKTLSPIAVRLAEPMVKELKESDKASDQVKILNIYRNALESAGRTAELKAIEVRIEKLESRLDAEYLATVPPFKPEPYAGRKEKEASKVAVLELFTGAQCPPCVAADVAFDALDKSYKPTDLILLQYHMHIPGPDPLTNPHTVARWDYYREKFPEGIRGTPSTVFNGKPDAGGGGNMAGAQNKYRQYKGLIDPILEEKTAVKVSGTVGRTGDKINVSATVSGVEPSDDLKLRLVVVEENIKYVGSNQLRFHHQVVRHLIGGPAGVKVSDKTFTHTAAADVADIKKGLTTYLDEFHANRPFPYKHRPMDLGHLKVIALVQDDKSLEILQAAELTPGAVKTSTTIDQK